MKKALAFIAIALVAVASQAATIKWTSGAMFEAADANGTWSTSAKAKGTVTATYLLVSSDTYNTYKAGGQTLYDDFKAGKITSTEKSNSIASNNGGQANFTGTTTFAAGGTGYVLAIYEYTSATYGDFFIATSGYDEISDVDVAKGVASSNLAPNVGKWTPVPEPTTIALLALGLAALGLKRKNA